MPRAKQQLTIEQIQEFLLGKASPETVEAIKSFLQAELNRREKAGKSGGKPRKYEGDAKERNRISSQKYRERKGNQEGI